MPYYYSALLFSVTVDVCRNNYYEIAILSFDSFPNYFTKSLGFWRNFGNSSLNILHRLYKFIKEKFTLVSIKETNHKLQLQLSSFKRALSFAYPYRWKVIIILSLTLFVAGLNVGEPQVMKFFFDRLHSKDAFPIIIKGILFLIGSPVIKEIMGGLTNYLTGNTRIKILYTLQMPL